MFWTHSLLKLTTDFEHPIPCFHLHGQSGLTNVTNKFPPALALKFKANIKIIFSRCQPTILKCMDSFLETIILADLTVRLESAQQFI